MTCVDQGISFLIIHICILLSFSITTIMCVQKTAEYHSLVVFQNRRSSCHCWPEQLFQIRSQLDKIPLETTIYQRCKLACDNDVRNLLTIILFTCFKSGLLPWVHSSSWQVTKTHNVLVSKVFLGYVLNLRHCNIVVRCSGCVSKCKGSVLYITRNK